MKKNTDTEGYKHSKSTADIATLFVVHIICALFSSSYALCAWLFMRMWFFK